MNGHPQTLRRCTDPRGFTLVELMIAIVASSIVIIGLSTLVSSFVNTYRFQEANSDMVQNAHYTVQRISEAVMETGACLPVFADTVMYYDSTQPNTFTRRYNPACGYHEFWDTAAATDVFHVDTMGAHFDPSVADSVVVARTLPSDVDSTVWRAQIVSVSLSKDTIITYDTVDAVITADTTILGADSLTVDGVYSVEAGDVIYAYKIETWTVNADSNLVVRRDGDEMVMAENIVELDIRFDSTDASGTMYPVNDWHDMKNGTVRVVTRTAVKNTKGEYGTQSFESRFRLKSVLAAQ